MDRHGQTGGEAGVPRAPAPAPDARDLPHALTFFLTARERAAVLRALRRVHHDRGRALLIAAARAARGRRRGR